MENKLNNQQFHNLLYEQSVLRNTNFKSNTSNNEEVNNNHSTNSIKSNVEMARTPQKDTVEIKSNKNKHSSFALGGLITLAVVSGGVLIDTVFCHGKHINKILEKLKLKKSTTVKSLADFKKDGFKFNHGKALTPDGKNYEGAVECIDSNNRWKNVLNYKDGQLTHADSYLKDTNGKFSDKPSFTKKYKYDSYGQIDTIETYNHSTDKTKVSNIKEKREAGLRKFDEKFQNKTEEEIGAMFQQAVEEIEYSDSAYQFVTKSDINVDNFATKLADDTIANIHKKFGHSVSERTYHVMIDVREGMKPDEIKQIIKKYKLEHVFKPSTKTVQDSNNKNIKLIFESEKYGITENGTLYNKTSKNTTNFYSEVRNEIIERRKDIGFVCDLPKIKDKNELLNCYKSIFNKNLSNNQLEEIAKKYNEIFKIDDAETFVNKLVEQLKKDYGIENIKTKVIVQKLKDNEIKTLLSRNTKGCANTLSGNIQFFVPTSTNVLDDKGKLQVFETAFHELKHLKQFSFAFRTNPEEFINNSLNSSNFSKFIKETINEKELEEGLKPFFDILSKLNKCKDKNSLVNLFKNDPSDIIIYNELKKCKTLEEAKIMLNKILNEELRSSYDKHFKDIDYFLDEKVLKENILDNVSHCELIKYINKTYGNAKPLTKGTEEYLTGQKYLDAIKNYTDADVDYEAYRKNLLEVEAWEIGDTAKRIADYLKNIEQ